MQRISPDQPRDASEDGSGMIVSQSPLPKMLNPKRKPIDSDHSAKWFEMKELLGAGRPSIMTE